MSQKEFTFAMICLVAYVVLFVYLTNAVSPRYKSDVNRDGKVDIKDVSIVLSNIK